MEHTYDYKKFAILYVDDEEKSLKYFARAFEEHFRILTAPNAQEGYALLQKHQDDIAILMTDQRMPGEKGTWLLEKARQLRPNIVRILATAYADMDAAIAAVNTGSIYKYVTKPWDPPQLETTLKRGLEFFIVQRERDQLLQEKMSVLHRVMIADRIMSLGLLAAGLSHHVRNSLVAVKTFLDLAPTKLKEENLDLNGLRNPEFWKDYYQKAQSQIDRINTMLRDLWAASEQRTNVFKDQVNLNHLIREVVAELQSSLGSRQLEVENSVSEVLPVLTVDRMKFGRLFELLLKDEIASLPPGSAITISASAKPVVGTEAPSIVIEVRDNGPGLPQEALRLVFDPFALRSDSPLEYGINLMAVYFIVHHHGGRIEAESTEGKGTTFRITVPINCEQSVRSDDSSKLLDKVLINEKLWEKLMVAE
ncbi:MAG: hybrid sensor histidine kinase/response regulator [Verrucomicrobia bacterium]|nr:hybrid sensor histidine kinase/response regulator [Verrucomicrobiota bacterium]